MCPPTSLLPTLTETHLLPCSFRPVSRRNERKPWPGRLIGACLRSKPRPALPSVVGQPHLIRGSYVARGSRVVGRKRGRVTLMRLRCSSEPLTRTRTPSLSRLLRARIRYSRPLVERGP